MDKKISGNANTGRHSGESVTKPSPGVGFAFCFLFFAITRKVLSAKVRSSDIFLLLFFSPRFVVRFASDGPASIVPFGELMQCACLFTMDEGASGLEPRMILFAFLFLLFN